MASNTLQTINIILYIEHSETLEKSEFQIKMNIKIQDGRLFAQ